MVGGTSGAGERRAQSAERRAQTQRSPSPAGEGLPRVKGDQPQGLTRSTGPRGRAEALSLAAQAETLDERTVTVDVRLLEVSQEAAALTNEQQ